MPDQRATSIVLRLSTVGAGLAAGCLVHKLVDAVWQRAIGHSSPATDDEDRPLAEVAVAAALTGALVALARLLAARGASKAGARLLRTCASPGGVDGSTPA